MPFIEWTDELSVGVEVIDNQHKRLIELIDNFHNAHINGHSKDELEEAIDEFYAYCLDHFALEERFMDQYSYPDYDAHIKQHLEGTMKAGEFFGDFLAGSEGLDEEFLIFLKKWLVNHILVVDRKLGEYLCGKGVATGDEK